jgi:hypothetical protein
MLMLGTVATISSAALLAQMMSNRHMSVQLRNRDRVRGVVIGCPKCLCCT